VLPGKPPLASKTRQDKAAPTPNNTKTRENADFVYASPPLVVPLTFLPPRNWIGKFDNFSLLSHPPGHLPHFDGAGVATCQFHPLIMSMQVFCWVSLLFGRFLFILIKSRCTIDRRYESLDIIFAENEGWQ
jgi:hypothetical protein